MSLRSSNAERSLARGEGGRLFCSSSSEWVPVMELCTSWTDVGLRLCYWRAVIAHPLFYFLVEFKSTFVQNRVVYRLRFSTTRAWINKGDSEECLVPLLIWSGSRMMAFCLLSPVFTGGSPSDVSADFIMDDLRHYSVLWILEDVYLALLESWALYRQLKLCSQKILIIQIIKFLGKILVVKILKM